MAAAGANKVVGCLPRSLNCITNLHHVNNGVSTAYNSENWKEYEYVVYVCCSTHTSSSALSSSPEHAFEQSARSPGDAKLRPRRQAPAQLAQLWTAVPRSEMHQSARFDFSLHTWCSLLWRPHCRSRLADKARWRIGSKDTSASRRAMQAVTHVHHLRMRLQHEILVEAHGCKGSRICLLPVGHVAIICCLIICRAPSHSRTYSRPEPFFLPWTEQKTRCFAQKGQKILESCVFLGPYQKKGSGPDKVLPWEGTSSKRLRLGGLIICF
jgi:hypothetical protein